MKIKKRERVINYMGNKILIAVVFAGKQIVADESVIYSKVLFFLF